MSAEIFPTPQDLNKHPLIEAEFSDIKIGPKATPQRLEIPFTLDEFAAIQAMYELATSESIEVLAKASHRYAKSMRFMVPWGGALMHRETALRSFALVYQHNANHLEISELEDDHLIAYERKVALQINTILELWFGDEIQAIFETKDVA